HLAVQVVAVAGPAMASLAIGLLPEQPPALGDVARVLRLRHGEAGEGNNHRRKKGESDATRASPHSFRSIAQELSSLSSCLAAILAFADRRIQAGIEVMHEPCLVLRSPALQWKRNA